MKKKKITHFMIFGGEDGGGGADYRIQRTVCPRRGLSELLPQALLWPVT